MALFESLVFLLFIAALLMAASRRLAIPYPTLLCVCGVGVAFLPFSPEVTIEPHLALAIFIAPALLDAAFDTSPRALKRFWIGLLVLAVGVVAFTTAAVAFTAVYIAGLPVAAAIALGAIVAPPDAAAANAVLGHLDFPRRSSLILQGESLLNDASALLILGIATALAAGYLSDGWTIRLALAAPGAILFGISAGFVYVRLIPAFARTLSSTILEFTTTFGIWLMAERFHLSPVLAVVAFAMLIARRAHERQSARDRVQSYSVWAAAVFILNVIAFLLMGLQVRTILTRLPHAELGDAMLFALLILIIVILVRMLCILTYRAFSGALHNHGFWGHELPSPPPWRISFLISWCGMRGLLTLATAMSLPSGFPGRDQITLVAFAVVLGTLVIQGLTLRPLMRVLGVGEDDGLERELSQARNVILSAGLAAAEREPGHVGDLIRAKLEAAKRVAECDDDPQGPTEYDAGLTRIVHAQREALHKLRHDGAIADDIFIRLQEELDWTELATRPNRDLELRAT